MATRHLVNWLELCIVLRTVGGRNSSFLEHPTRDLQGRGFDTLQERRQIFLLQSSLPVLTLIRCPFHTRGTTVARKSPGHSAKSAGGRLHPNTLTPVSQRSRIGLTMLYAQA